MELRRYGQNPTLETRGEAEQKVDKEKRYAQIIEVLRESHRLTAKEIAVKMMDYEWIPTSERNFVSPRLTELCKKGIVEPIGKKVCEFTGHKVTVFQLREVR